MPEPEQNNSKQRRVKNPETFRERAVKAAAESDKPNRSHKFRSAPIKVLRPVASPIGRFLRKLFKIQPFKTIGWVAKFIGKILLPNYVRSSFRELKLVTWPNWRLSRRLTYAVLGFAIVFGVSIALVDYALDKVFKQILLK